MVKSLILVTSMILSGFAYAGNDFNYSESDTPEYRSFGAEEVLGGLLLIGIIGKLLDKDDDHHDHNKKDPVYNKTRRVRIPMYGELAEGANAIYLRTELNEMGVNLRDRRLKKVTLIAKSRHGQGNAFLLLGNNQKATKNIGDANHGYSFQSNAAESYRTVSWDANRKSDDIWQIHLTGQIKVKAVVVELE